MTIRTRLGLAIAAGVPVLVLVSVGPVAGLTGAPSVLVWAASATVGLFMALPFAELAGSFPHHTGGIGVLAGRVFAPRSRALALLSQWSYWFGWSPALALNGMLVGNYLHHALLPRTPSWTAVLLATAVLAGSVTVNHFGLRHGALLQALLGVLVAGTVGVLVGGALLHHQFDPGRLLPFAPPRGWASGHGIVALAGGLFIAGWSAYGAELALSYATEYRHGARDAVNALLFVAAVSVVSYSIVPLVLVGVVGIEQIQADPVVALAPLVHQAAGGAAGLVVGMLVAALLLGLNMVTISSSRVLYQMSRNGDAWAFLGQLNRHGVPANALRFDLFVNLLLLLAILASNGGRTTDVPVALLAAANVGYLLSISLALVAAWLNRRRRGHDPSRLLRIRPGLIRLGLVLAAFNLLLLAFAGFAWGWTDLALGVVILAAVIVTFTRTSRRAHGLLAVRPQPTCMAWGARRRTATLEELAALQLTGEAKLHHGPTPTPANANGGPRARRADRS